MHNRLASNTLHRVAVACKLKSPAVNYVETNCSPVRGELFVCYKAILKGRQVALTASITQ